MRHAPLFFSTDSLSTAQITNDAAPASAIFNVGLEATPQWAMNYFGTIKLAECCIAKPGPGGCPPTALRAPPS